MIDADGAELRVRHPNWFTLLRQGPRRHHRARATTGTTTSISPQSASAACPTATAISCVGEATLTLTPGEWVGVVASLDRGRVHRSRRSHASARSRTTALQLSRAKSNVAEMRNAPPWIDQLVLAADSFVFARPLPGVPDGESVIAGYPWFGDWGRDTMIALPGLALATGRFDTASRILRTFARFVDRGMLPNVFPGSGETPEYNTVDAALWYLEAWRAYVEATGDLPALREAFPVLRDIIDWHVKGTRYGIARGSGRRPAARGRARRAAHLDGRQGRRLGGDAAHRQAGGDQRAVVQRAVR